MSDRNRRKTLVGIVTSNKMDKSIVVSIEETPLSKSKRWRLVEVVEKVK